MRKEKYTAVYSETNPDQVLKVITQEISVKFMCAASKEADKPQNKDALDNVSDLWAYEPKGQTKNYSKISQGLNPNSETSRN